MGVPLVQAFFEEMRLSGKYVDACDLEDQLMSITDAYVAEGAKPEVEQSTSPEAAARVEFLEKELAKMRNPLTKKSVHEHRQLQVMRFCECRLRKPQRLTVLTIAKEHMRWVSSLMSYGRLLWEGMRPEEFSTGQLVDIEAWLREIVATRCPCG